MSIQMEEIEVIINDLVDIKINEMLKVDFVRYRFPNGRLNYEIESLNEAISNYNDDIKILYLERLKMKIIDLGILIYDHTPIDYPNITQDFLECIDKYLLDWKLNNTQTRILKNPCPEMFVDCKSYHLFNDYILKANKSKFLREASFIYRIMSEYEKPSLIHAHIKPGMFKNWFNKKYPKLDYLSEVKTYSESSTTERKIRYKELKDIIFKQYSTQE